MRGAGCHENGEYSYSCERKGRQMQMLEVRQGKEGKRRYNGSMKERRYEKRRKG